MVDLLDYLEDLFRIEDQLEALNTLSADISQIYSRNY